jgi:hypothetical protein
VDAQTRDVVAVARTAPQGFCAVGVALEQEELLVGDAAVAGRLGLGEAHEAGEARAGGGRADHARHTVVVGGEVLGGQDGSARAQGADGAVGHLCVDVAAWDAEEADGVAFEGRLHGGRCASDGGVAEADGSGRLGRDGGPRGEAQEHDGAQAKE